MRGLVILLAVGAGAGACSGRDSAPATRFDGGPPPRRVIGAPPRHVRALPPHAIGAEGVGPYKLGVPMTQVLSTLPSGPRMTLLQIAGVLDYSVVRDEGLLVGGERQGTASFIAVVRQDIARTDDGVGVGATLVALEKAVGPPLASPSTATDPALWRGARLPGARFVLSGDRVTGVLLMTAPGGGTAPPGPDAPEVGAGVPAPRCDRSASGPDLSAAAGGVTFVPACLGSAEGVGWSGDTVVVAGRGGSDPRARRVATTEVRGLRWVAPIEVDRGRDELVAVAESGDDDSRTYTVVMLRLEGSRLTRTAEAEVYRLDSQRAAWIGASLEELTLHLEARVDGDSLEVGGVLVHRGTGAVRELAPLLPVTVRRRGRTADADRAREVPDAGVHDAHALPAPDAGPPALAPL